MYPLIYCSFYILAVKPLRFITDRPHSMKLLKFTIAVRYCSAFNLRARQVVKTNSDSLILVFYNSNMDPIWFCQTPAVNGGFKYLDMLDLVTKKGVGFSIKKLTKNYYHLYK